MRGLMMGRFQPFHRGHLDLAGQILRECDELIIAITSSQFNYLQRDPFTAGERLEMIHGSLREASFDMALCHVVSLENQFNVAGWASYLRSSLPGFDRVYSGNDYVAMLLADSGITVRRPDFLDVERFNATRIRSMIESGDDLQALVPDTVREMLARINARDRLTVISKSDTDPTKY